MKQYLVIQLARFGDLVQTKRLLATLCARPDAEVHLCLDNSLESLARLLYPGVVLHPVTAHGTGLSGAEAVRAMLLDNRRAFAELKGIDFNRIYNLNFSGLNFRLAALFDPDRVEGYSWRNGQELVGQWPSMGMRWSGSRRIGINLVDFWGAYCPDMIPPQSVNPEASPKGGGIGVVLAGRESRRSLPVEQLALAASTLAQKGKAESVCLLGGKSEAAAGQAVLRQLPPAIQDRTTNLAGKTDWDGLVDLVGQLDLLLTPDTGTMHLAAHLGTPVAACFLSSAWCFETGPYGAGHMVYQAITGCSPCLETDACNNDMACLNGFSSSGFQRYLVTGKPDHIPENMTAFRSCFDDLGQVYEPVAGSDPDADVRKAFRTFIHQYLTGSTGEISEMEGEIARQFYREPDWIGTAPKGIMD
jgi:hypothetical protein